MGRERQSWQIDDCPPWCAGGHREDDPPEDRVHRSAGTAVPVVARAVSYDDGSRQVAIESVELDIGISRADGSRETWFYMGSGPDRYLEISGESAARLLGAASVELRRMHGSWQ
ncbi:MAG: hypothetical protein WA006_05560 [Rhodoglobus sp.]